MGPGSRGRHPDTGQGYLTGALTAPRGVLQTPHTRSATEVLILSPGSQVFCKLHTHSFSIGFGGHGPPPRLGLQDHRAIPTWWEPCRRSQQLTARRLRSGRPQTHFRSSSFPSELLVYTCGRLPMSHSPGLFHAFPHKEYKLSLKVGDRDSRKQLPVGRMRAGPGGSRETAEHVSVCQSGASPATPPTRPHAPELALHLRVLSSLCPPHRPPALPPPPHPQVQTASPPTAQAPGSGPRRDTGRPPQALQLGPGLNLASYTHSGFNVTASC